ncbi:MAG: formyltransferase family protein, partial [Candidatus Odinarchaeia archaeon]
RLRRLIIEYDIKNVDISELYNFNFKIGISVNYNKIISEDVIKLAALRFWNIHHSYNLRLRGRNITTHAILATVKDNIYYHGTTLHQIVPKLDAGPIVASKSTPIYDIDTAYSLFSRLDDIAYELIYNWLPRISFEKVYLYQPPKEGIKYFKKVDLPSKEIPQNISDREFYDYVRAFDFIGHSPAYTILDDKKVELVLFERGDYVFPIKLRGKIFYTNTKG